jgi:sugar diacid utilization regulator
MFHTGGSVTIQVVMVCCGRPATEGLVELYKIFLEYIKIYVDRDSAAYGSNNAVKTLALDLIMKNVSSQEEARNRAAYAGFPFEGNFRLVMVSFDDEENIPLSRLVQSYAEVFPQASVFSQNRNVLILDVERGEMPQFKAVLDRALASAEFHCGISNRFHCLWDIGIAYEQAIIAVDLAGRLKLSADAAANPQRRFYCQFSDYWIYHLLSTGIKAAPVVYKNSFLFHSVEKLREYDTLHHTDIMNLLRIYLENERKATIVSSLLHMHRNTVLYHIGKIESILGVSLDDPEVRLKLQLAFKANDFKPGEFSSGK